MATYNGSRYLREQLDSILCQLHPDDELIVSDDHSTDDTACIVESYSDARIRFIYNPLKRGHVRNFAHAMAQARGEVIALSDQDDIWVEHRLEKMLDALLRSPKRVLVVGDFVEFDKNGILDARNTLGSSPESQLYQLCNIFAGRAKYFGSAFAFRRELLRYVLPIPPRIEAHDIWIAMNACLHGGVVHLQETTLLRRLHGDNLTLERHRALPAVVRSRLFYIEGLMRSSLR
jgi:glycosyltransferase involved in cell wall biosynthesis